MQTEGIAADCAPDQAGASATKDENEVGAGLWQQLRAVAG
jgi:hypothetical protein